MQNVYHSNVFSLEGTLLLQDSDKLFLKHVPLFTDCWTIVLFHCKRNPRHRTQTLSERCFNGISLLPRCRHTIRIYCDSSALRASEFGRRPNKKGQKRKGGREGERRSLQEQDIVNASSLPLSLALCDTHTHSLHCSSWIRVDIIILKCPLCLYRGTGDVPAWQLL